MIRRREASCHALNRRHHLTGWIIASTPLWYAAAIGMWSGNALYALIGAIPGSAFAVAYAERHPD